MTGLNDLRICVQAADDLAGRIHLRLGCIGDLVQNHHIGKFHLVGQQMDERALILIAHDLAAVAQEIMAGEISGQIHRINNGYHGIKPGHIGQAAGEFVPKIECRRNW